MMDRRNNVVIIGAGLTGSLLAIFLAKRGFQISIYEKRGDIRQLMPDKKRTIAMSISYRGWKALEVVGLDTKLLGSSTATYGRITYTLSGKSYRQYYGDKDEAIHTIDRKTLNSTLLDMALSYENCRVHFNSEIEQIDFQKKSISVRNEQNAKPYDYLFSTDGVFSVGRQEFERIFNLNCQIEKLSIGYKEFTIPYKVIEELNLSWDKSFVHVWPVESANFVALPSDEKQAFMGNLFCNNDWIEFFDKKPSKSDMVGFLAPQFPLLKGVLEKLEEICFNEPSSNIYTTYSNHWSYLDHYLMLGDAVHSMAPFYAMGMNMCFEDCLVFDILLNGNSNNLSETIKNFQQVRKIDVDAMQRLAMNNFNNLLQSSEVWFDQEWRLDRLLSDYCPEHWASESALVSFKGLPISDIERRVVQQKRFIVDNKLSYQKLSSQSISEIDILCQKIKSNFSPLK